MLLNIVELQPLLEQRPIDLLRPVPVKIGHRFEPPDPGNSGSPFEIARTFLVNFTTRYLLQKLQVRPLQSSGAGQQIIKISGGRPKSDLK